MWMGATLIENETTPFMLPRVYIRYAVDVLTRIRKIFSKSLLGFGNLKSSAPEGLRIREEFFS
jgi:hypothetical protein